MVPQARFADLPFLQIHQRLISFPSVNVGAGLNTDEQSSDSGGVSGTLREGRFDGYHAIPKQTHTMKPGRLHPAAIVTGACGGTWLGGVKRWVVRHLYNHLAHAYPIDSWTTMNYGYAPLEGEPAFAAVPGENSERYALNLYWRVATMGRHGVKLRGLDVVEIGSGRGGGAAFLAAALAPRCMIGVDIAETATRLAKRRYGAGAHLQFRTGDAENLSLDDSSVDVAINIESAHCYASMPRFLNEVARILRQDGELLFAGFAARRGGAYDRLVAALGGGSLRLKRLDDITSNVVRSLAADEARKRAFIETNVAGPMKNFALGAYAMEGSNMRRALEGSQTAYIAAVLRKP